MKLLSVLILLAVGAIAAFAQTTEFTYQGRLLDNNLPATGAYDFEFRLYDAETAGAIIGTATRSGVPVSNGVFTVRLNFDNQFTGAPRFLEIALKPAGNAGGYQQLLPRQVITSMPYAIRSLTSANAENALSAVNSTNAAQLGGIAANQYVVTTDPRLADDRSPLAGSLNYVQNTNVEQPSTNFNIAGSGRVGGSLSANIINSATQYNYNGNRVLGVGGVGDFFVDSSFYVGIGAGANNTGARNSFFGGDAGRANTIGTLNSFFGFSAGKATVNGSSNSFFGANAGENNTTGFDNSFFGNQAGRRNTEGFRNAFFGNGAGISNTTGKNNSFYGVAAGAFNSTGEVNSFFGIDAGSQNTTGNDNSFFGAAAGFDNTTGIQNSYFGKQAGRNNNGGNNVFVGYQSGFNSTEGFFNVFVGTFAGNTNTTGGSNTIIGNNADVGTGTLTFATAIGASAVVSTSNTIVLGRASGADKVRIFGLGSAGSTPLCRNASNEISTCASPLAESNVAPMLEALKTQETKIAAQQKQIDEQKKLIDALKELVCTQNPGVKICQAEKRESKK